MWAGDNTVDYVVAINDDYLGQKLFRYDLATKPGYTVVGGMPRKKKGSPGGEFLPHPDYPGCLIGQDIEARSADFGTGGY